MQPQFSTLNPLTQKTTENVKKDELELRLLNLKSMTTDFSTLSKEMKELHQNPGEYWYAMGSRLQKIITNQLYRAGGYKSFSEYCIRCLGYSRQHAYKLINVVNFIDEQLLKAKTSGDTVTVRRLFSLGFS